jgi:NADP-dependent 3-hydroxy acid dehydrogenase YdfG
MPSIVFITGATSGFGLACAELFASNGYHLIINGRREDRLHSTATDLQDRFGIKVRTASFDVSDQQKVNEVISGLPPEWATIDILINNAGLAAGRDYFEEASLSDWNQKRLPKKWPPARKDISSISVLPLPKWSMKKEIHIVPLSLPWMR